MKTEMGEYIVGSFLKIIKECDVISYNVRPPGGGLTGLGELDVIGLNLKTQTAYLCEVTTHIRGVLYSNYKTTITKIEQKYKRQQEYAKKYLPNFKKHVFMFWAPIVPKGIAEKLAKIQGLELKINKNYTEAITELRTIAKKRANDEGNPFFRALQILEHLRS